MCVIIDTNTLHKVFGEKDGDFTPVRTWIICGPAKIIIGGSTYKRELSGASKYLRVIRELDLKRKVVRISDQCVDEAENQLRGLPIAAQFNDQHLVALTDESGCRVLCSEDKKADKYIRDKSLYKKSGPPSIYRYSKHHQHLLCDANITTVCR
jgi:hypothetical protein